MGGSRQTVGVFATFVFAALAAVLGLGGANAQRRPEPAATAAAATTATAVERTLCEAKFVAPLKTFVSTKKVTEWEPPSERESKPSVVVSCASCGASGDAGADAGKPDVDAKTFEGDVLELRNKLAPEVDVRIATVADPIDSGLQYYFDMQVEGLQLAIEQEGFARDQSWLPWVDAQASDEKARATSEGCRREIPGVIVFRPTAKSSSKVVVLLLVGETPTSGVQKAALAKAIAFHTEMSRKNDGPPATLRIVGPTFSGSAASLRATIDREWTGDDALVVSGSATSRDAAKIMSAEGAGHRRVTFKLTTIPEDELQCALFGYLWWAHDLRGVRERKRIELKGVALLRESGTSFGAARQSDYECEFVPDVDLRFPLHIGSVRDAYEDDDPVREHREGMPVRRTTLDVKLKERNKPRDIQSDTSVKTPIGRDLVLAQLLGAIARENVRYVAIQATDSADVIFLARKIRDVAPDVRLVIFGNDVLYTHSELRPLLLGSFVVTPYPFFGANSFSKLSEDEKHDLEQANRPIPPQAHLPFESAMAEGAYNASLAVSPEPTRTTYFAEYDFLKKRSEDQPDPPVLPLWIGTIASDGVLPIAVRRPTNCGGFIYGRDGVADDQPFCQAKHRREARKDPKLREKLWLSNYILRVEPDVTPPNLWQFLFALLMVATFLDFIQGRAARGAMEQPSKAERRSGLADGALDRALIRSKHAFYVAIRRQILLAALVVMLLIQSLAIATYAGHLAARQFPVFLLMVGFASTVAATFGVVSAWRRHANWRRILRHQLRRRRTDTPNPIEADAIPATLRAIWRPIALELGFNPPSSARAVIAHTLNQLRLLVIISALVSIPMLGLFVWEIENLDPRFGSVLAFVEPTNPNVAMFVLRALPLVNRVSPAAPLLACLLCCYVWACGRSSRLRELHAVALMTPAEGARDGVSLPIAHVLHGIRSDEEGRALCDAEKRLVTSISRPSHSPVFFFAMAGAAFFPVVAFVLKPPTTLEAWQLTGVLVGLLGICAVIIAATLVQLGLYWTALSKLLDRIQTHPTAESFDDVPGPLKESLDSQVSRRRDDAHRLAACVRRFEELVRTRASVREQLPTAFRNDDLGERLAQMEHELVVMQQARSRPLEISEWSEGGPLGRTLVDAAAAVRAGLEEVWSGAAGPWGSPRIGRIRPAQEEGLRDKDERVDAMTRFDHENAPTDAVAWLRRAHSFIAAVVALLLNRHVRQFRIFLYSSTTSALLLLAALASYAFQPRRLLLTCLWAIMASVVAGCGYVYVQLDRNVLLSRVAGTKPGRLELNASFATRIIGWVAFPLLSVAAAQYPEVASKLFSWMEPFLNALK